jgi:hypothetical protein
MVRIAVVTSGFIALLGCSAIESEDLLTSGMYADVVVTADGEGTSDVLATLRAGGALSTTFVELTGDDVLTVTLAEETVIMNEISLGNLNSFVAEFQTDEPGIDYTISLERSLDEGAPSTVIRLPAAFVVDAPTISEFARSTEDLTVTWTPSDSGDNMRVTLDGDCFLLRVDDLSGDPGTWTLAGGLLEDTGTESTNCEADITIERRLLGVLDPNYSEGGSATGVQQRTVSIESTP